jgi:hypothetical protein
MAISSRAAIGAALTTNSTGFTVVIPSTTVLGDHLWLLVANRGAAASMVITDNDGGVWTSVGSGDNTGRGELFHRRATADTASKTITGTGATESCSASLWVTAGTLLVGTPWEAVSVEVNASGNETHAAITTLGAGRWVMLCVCNLNNDVTVTLEDATDPNTITHQIEHLNNPAGGDCATVIAAAAQGAAGSTGTFTWAQSNQITVSIALAIIPQPTITFLEPGTDATGDLSFYSSTSGTVASATDQAYTGSRSIKCSLGAPATAARVERLGVLADAGRRISFRMRCDTIPAAGTTAFCHLTTSGGTLSASMSMRTDGTIEFQPDGATAVTGSTVVAANTWPRFAVAYTVTSATVFRFDFYVNGFLQGSATVGTMTTIATDMIQLRANAGFGDNANVWFDDLYIDDGADYTDPGAGFDNSEACRVYAVPAVANNVNTFDTGVGATPANRWTNVNEVPLSETNGWQQAATADTQENYTLATRNAMGLTPKTILGRAAWIWAKGAAGGAGTPKIMDNGVETAIVLTSAGKLFTVLTTNNSYPSNAAGIGMRATNNADNTFLYECGTLVAASGTAYPAVFPQPRRPFPYRPSSARPRW